MNFKTKDEFIRFIKYQLGIELSQENNFNEDENVLYTIIPRHKQISLLSYLDKIGIRHEEHLNDKYWLWINDEWKKDRC